MKKYIEREAARNMIEDWSGGFDYIEESVYDAIADLGAIPAVDVRPVVLCRDCKHYKAENRGKPWKSNRFYCCRSVCVATNPDDFCSRGEKREES